MIIVYKHLGKIHGLVILWDKESVTLPFIPNDNSFFVGLSAYFPMSAWQVMQIGLFLPTGNCLIIKPFRFLHWLPVSTKINFYDIILHFQLSKPEPQIIF